MTIFEIYGVGIAVAFVAFAVLWRDDLRSVTDDPGPFWLLLATAVMWPVVILHQTATVIARIARSIEQRFTHAPKNLHDG